MNKLTTEKRAAILGALIEGCSIRATCRMTGASKVTVLRLLRDAGQFCQDFHDITVRGLDARRIQCDEAWGFVGCKDKAKKSGATGYGSAWTWVAQDADSKLVIAYLVGQRDQAHADAFMRDVADRVVGRVQVSTDALSCYPAAMEAAFGGDVDFGVIVKQYAAPRPDGPVRYSPSVCIGCTKEAVMGGPEGAHISTSCIERQNRDLRMRNRRMTRLTDAFSRKIENHVAATALHYFAFNFVKYHATLKTTPAVMAGLATKPMTALDLARMIEREECALGGRLTDYLASASAAK